MHNDLTSSLSTSILWLFDTMYVFFFVFFLAKAQKEAYERKEKEKAKQARTQVRNEDVCEPFSCQDLIIHTPC